MILDVIFAKVIILIHRKEFLSVLSQILYTEFSTIFYLIFMRSLQEET
jgi:hypothetical protein